jgi:two-component system chemotaxis response regulator CheY
MPIPMDYLNIICLAVDDEANMRKTIVNMLSKMGFKNIITAEDGKKALSIISTSKIDLVICDINMPEMTGLELFKTIKENPKNQNINFVFVTAEVRRETVARAAEDGGQAYIIKPFVMATLEDKILNVLNRKFKPSGLETHLKNFHQYMDNRDTQTAENELKKAAEIAPENPTILYNFGQLSLITGETDKAVEFFKSAIEKKPMFVKAYDALGKIYEDSGDMESAIRYYEAANEISSANADRLIILSRLYKTKGEMEKAEHILKDAVSSVREDVSTSGHLMGELYLAKNENEKALEALLKAYKRNSYDTSIMQSLAEAYRKLGRQDQAIEKYEEIIKITPNSADAYYHMGKAYIEMANKNKAIEAIKKAWELNPSSREITADLRALAEKEKINL